MRDLSRRNLSYRRLDSACRGCVHWRPVCESRDGKAAESICHYLLDVGHMRGCPAGPGCTKYQPDDGKFQKADFSTFVLDAEIVGALTPEEVRRYENQKRDDED